MGRMTARLWVNLTGFNGRSIIGDGFAVWQFAVESPGHCGGKSGRCLAFAGWRAFVAEPE